MLSVQQRRAAKAGKPKHSKRYAQLTKGLKKDELHAPEEALAKIKEMATAKFDETVEMAVNLGVDSRHGDQMVRGTTSLPYGTGKTRKVAVFAKGDKAAEAEAAGADRVGAEDLIAEIKAAGGGPYDLYVASPDMMALLGQGGLGPILKAKMPNPKAGTVTPNVEKVIKEIKGATRCEYRVEKGNIIHAPIGKVSYPAEHLLANAIALLTALQKAKPAAAKGRYFKKVTVTCTMGPSLQVDHLVAAKMAEK